MERLVVIVVFSSSLLCMCSTMPISTYDTSLGKLKNVNYGLRVLKEFAQNYTIKSLNLPVPFEAELITDTLALSIYNKALSQDKSDHDLMITVETVLRKIIELFSTTLKISPNEVYKYAFLFKLRSENQRILKALKVTSEINNVNKICQWIGEHNFTDVCRNAIKLYTNC